MGVPVCLVPGKNNNVTHSPLWEIPIRDLIEYFKKVEAAYSADSPTEILTRIRVHYYGDIRFEVNYPRQSRGLVRDGAAQSGRFMSRSRAA